MKAILKVAVPCALLALIARSVWPDVRELFRRPGKPLVAEADQLAATTVSPHLEAPLNTGCNVLWCGTFQLAWNEACALVGEDLHFAGTEPDAVAVLNRKSFAEDDLDEGSYVAVADFVGRNVFGAIQRELAQKFGGRAQPRLVPSKTGLRPQDIVAYAYLLKELQFASPFERIEEPLVFDGEPAACFGISAEYKPDHELLVTQVLVHDYAGPDDFVIELTTKLPGDRLILAKVEPQATLRETVEAVEARAGNKSVTAAPYDILKVPKFNFDVTRHFTELEGLLLRVDNPEVAKDLMILGAIQNVRFEANEKGVRLESESHLVFGCGMEPGPPPSRRIMVFDRPFLLMLQRADAARPYFALWVENAELLVPAGG